MIELAEKGLIPTPLIRIGIRKLLSARIKEEADNYKAQNYYENFIKKLEVDEIAVHTDDANEQHYEVPSDFFALVLGKHKKYSGCYWANAKNLDEAEADALRITCQRAEIKDGMDILELGCGWGSLSLWMAENYPHSKITAISNSNSQREYIENQCKLKKINNLTIITKNVVEFESQKQVDRIVSVEMFEHMRNYSKLFCNINSWLKPGGKLFVHIFSHSQYAYLFETEGSHNWMGKYFFTGGIMPNKNLLKEFMKPLQLDSEWSWNGTHYQKTSEAWHNNMLEHKVEIMKILNRTYPNQAKVWYHRWRIFFLACAELFGYENGNEWDVSHYLFRKAI
jgi:cyclopropane-fatty-acyl-phospholipid synthase